MCGIVGAVSPRNVVPILLDGLGRLEYRGYDSAGLVVVADGLQQIRSCGRVHELRRRVLAAGLNGLTGIAHTRWATHGTPTESNAHPHISRGLIAVVHNGIIENHDSLRAKLLACGYGFASETDSEVIPHLIHRAYLLNGGDLAVAVRAVTCQLIGNYAIAVVAADRPGQMVCARQGSPLVLGLGDGEVVCASDVYAMLPITRNMVHLEDGDVAHVHGAHISVVNRAGASVQRPTRVSAMDSRDTERGTYSHFMHKEIHEQPHVLAQTLATLSPTFDADVFGDGAGQVFRDITRVCIVACGTSYHAGLMARHWIETLADIPCEVDIASEYRYRAGYFSSAGLLLVVISQSGETADTLGALQYARERGVRHILSICNVAESAMTRMSNLGFITRAGPEIGVASTKAFTTQLVALYALAVSLALARDDINIDRARQCHANLERLPQWCADILLIEPALAKLACHFKSTRSALFIGRGDYYPVAMEGALKLKEISYIHAEAYPAGELKHGALALVNAEMPIIALVPKDPLIEKMRSNLQEVRARGGRLFVFADRASQMETVGPDHVTVLPGGYGELGPLPYTVALQLLAYHTAVLRGCDVDKPRNLAKSVTVE
jgi:glucosamine--fructose-6-phosphate aminotransferase (isomerizing)